MQVGHHRPAGPLHRGQRLAAVVARRRPRGAGLQHHERDAVPDGVVELAGEPGPVLEPARALLLRGEPGGGDVTEQRQRSAGLEPRERAAGVHGDQEGERDQQQRSPVDEPAVPRAGSVASARRLTTTTQ